MTELTGQQRAARFLIVGLVCSVAVWGLQFLPPNDYQPSRPLYASAWLASAAAGYVIVRRQAGFWKSVFLILIGIFGFMLAVSFLR